MASESNFRDTSDLFGHGAPAPIDPAQDSTEDGGEDLDSDKLQSGEGDDLESGEPGSTGADASDDDQDQNTDDDLDGDEDDPAKLRAELKTARDDAKTNELKRRGFQSDADQATKIASEAVTELRKLESQVAELSERAHESTIGDDDVLTGAQVKDRDAQRDERSRKLREDSQRKTEERQMNQFATNINNAVAGKPDIEQVMQYAEANNAAGNPEAPMLNTLGAYYRVKAEMLEKQVSDLKKRLKPGAKKPDKRTTTNKPPIDGGSSRRSEAAPQEGSIGAALAKKMAKLNRGPGHQA